MCENNCCGNLIKKTQSELHVFLPLLPSATSHTALQNKSISWQIRQVTPLHYTWQNPKAHFLLSISINPWNDSIILERSILLGYFEKFNYLRLKSIRNIIEGKYYSSWCIDILSLWMGRGLRHDIQQCWCIKTFLIRALNVDQKLNFQKNYFSNLIESKIEFLSTFHRFLLQL